MISSGTVEESRILRDTYLRQPVHELSTLTLVLILSIPFFLVFFSLFYYMAECVYFIDENSKNEKKNEKKNLDDIVRKERFVKYCKVSLKMCPIYIQIIKTV